MTASVTGCRVGLGVPLQLLEDTRGDFLRGVLLAVVSVVQSVPCGA